MENAAKVWKQQLQYELQGGDYNTLITLAEGIPILPFYTAENVKSAYAVSTHTQAAVALFVSDKEHTLKRIALWERYGVSFFLLTLHPTLSTAEVQQWLPSTLSYLFDNAFTIDTAIYQNAGASVVQQLAFGVAQLEETTVASPINVRVAIGGTFLLEIAKLRALRRLLAERTPTLPFRLIAEVSGRGLSLLKSTYNQHYIQLAYEAAVLGGADYLLPQSPLFFKKKSLPVEKEQITFIKELTATREAATLNGVYAIEALSYELYQKALVMLQQVHKQGGLKAMLKSHQLQKQIQEKAEQEQEFFRQRYEALAANGNTAESYTRKEWDFFPFAPKPHSPLPPRNLWEPEK